MKLTIALMLCAAAFAAAAPQAQDVASYPVDGSEDVQSRNILVNTLVRQLIAYLRHVINNGSIIFGVPPLDPLELESYHLVVPAEILNLDLKLEDIFAAGAGAFVAHKSDLDLRAMTFDVDVSVPVLNITAGHYDFEGDFLTAIPLYGKGKAKFLVKNFRFQARLFLKQSEDGKSVLIEKIDNAAYQVPSFKSDLDGAIGGGDIDAIVNAVIEDVIVDYVNRFQKPIAAVAADLIMQALNPILEQLDTWRYIRPLIPRN